MALQLVDDRAADEAGAAGYDREPAAALNRRGLGRGVHGDDSRMAFGQVPGPETGAARQFEHLSPWHGVAERSLDQRNFSKPPGTMLRPLIVAALPQEPLVVLGRPFPVADAQARLDTGDSARAESQQRRGRR